MRLFCTFASLALVLSAACEQDRLLSSSKQDPTIVPGQYTVGVKASCLNADQVKIDPDEAVRALARELLERHTNTRVLSAWGHAFTAFLADIPDAAVAEALAEHPCVERVIPNHTLAPPSAGPTMSCFEPFDYCVDGCRYSIGVPNRPAPNSSSPQPIQCSDPDPQENPPLQCIDNWGIDRLDSPSRNFQFDVPSNGGAGVHVYHLDTGVNANHQDLAGRVSGGLNAAVYAGQPGRFNTSDCYSNAHGTHTAGVIAGRTYGVARGAQIHPVKFLSPCPGDGNGPAPEAALIEGINWIAANYNPSMGPGIISLSGGNQLELAQNAVLIAGVDLLTRPVAQGGRGMLFVQAAGNQSQDACGYSFGSAVPAVFVVGGRDEDDEVWTQRPGDPLYNNPCGEYCGSNTGSCVDIWAPAAHIVSSGGSAYNCLCDEPAWGPTPNQAYCQMSGTSMAAPHASGVAAVYWGQNPNATAQEVMNALIAAADTASDGARLLRLVGSNGGGGGTEGTFGRQSVGVNRIQMSQNNKRASAFALTQPGNITALKAYLSGTFWYSNAQSQRIRGVIYSDASGAPGALLGTTNEILVYGQQAASWTTLSLPSPVSVPAGTYWLGLHSGDTSQLAEYYHDSVMPGQRRWNADTYTDGAASPFGTANADSNSISIHAVYQSSQSTTHSLSGNTGIAGATVTLSGAQSGSTISASDGSYSFSNLVPGSYTVTPSMPSCTFSPSSRTGISLPPDATNIGFSVSCVGAQGRFGKETIGAYVNGMSMNYKRASQFTLNDSASVTSLTAYVGGSTGYSSAQTQRVRGVIYADAFGLVPGNLLGTTSEIIITGGQAPEWRTMTFSSPINLSPGVYWLGLHTGGDVGLGQFYYDATGKRYSNSDTYADGAADPFGSGGSDVKQMSIYATYGGGAPQTYSVSGNAGIAGATISLSGAQSGSTVSASDGSYSFSNLVPGTYAVTPLKTGCTFTPASRSGITLPPSATSLGFTASCGGPSTVFDSNLTWPPTIANNPTAPVGGFALGLFAKCGADYRDGIPGTSPYETSTFVSNPAGYTGITATPSSFVCSSPGYDERAPSTFYQLDHSARAIGVWLNPTRLREGVLTSFNPGVDLQTPVAPWSSPSSSLSLQWDMKLPAMSWVPNHPKGEVVPYVVAYITIQHPQYNMPGTPGYQRYIWYGSGIFDPRGAGQYIGWDPGTNAAIIGQPLNSSSSFFHKGPGSSDSAQWTFSNTKHFDIVITRNELRNGLNAYNSMAPWNGWPTWPTDDASLAAMKVGSFTFNHEAADQVPHRFDRLQVALAHNNPWYPVSVTAHYQRSGLSGWQVGTTHVVPAGWSGWGERTFDLRGITGFTGQLTHLALNPDHPGSSTIFGFDYIRLVDPLSGESIKDWGYTSMWPNANPMPGQFSMDGSTFWIWWFMNAFAQDGGQTWIAELFPSAGYNSFQWTVDSVEIDPTPMIGASYWNIRLVHNQ